MHILNHLYPSIQSRPACLSHAGTNEIKLFLLECPGRFTNLLPSVPDNMLTASSVHPNPTACGLAQSRLTNHKNKNTAWCAKARKTGEWIQVCFFY